MLSPAAERVHLRKRPCRRPSRAPLLEVIDPMPDGRQTALSPDQAVDRLEAMHAQAVQAQRHALARFAAGGAPPTPDERWHFRYPELRLVWEPIGPIPVTRRAWGKFQAPGVYATTVTQPSFFRPYLLEQLRPLIAEYGASVQVHVSDQEMPYPYVLDRGDELAHSDASPVELARHFPSPLLSAVGDEVADGLWTSDEGQARPLRCSMQCVSITRYAACSTTLAPTGVTSSPGSC